MHSPCSRTRAFPVRLATPVLMMLTPLQLPSVYHNPSCDGCARDAEENRMRKEELGPQNVTKERGSVICTFR